MVMMNIIVNLSYSNLLMFLRGKLTPCSLCCSLDRHSVGALAFVYFHIAMPVIIIVSIISTVINTVIVWFTFTCYIAILVTVIISIISTIVTISYSHCHTRG